jgi:signal transduction histidine kinase
MPKHALAVTEIEPTLPPTPRGLDEEAKRSFLRMISHELRTPLNSIIGFSEVLRYELCGPLGSPRYKEYASFIGESGEKMLKLVNQIVEIVRLESQAADLDVRNEPLEALVNEALESLQPEAQAWDVKLKAEDPSAMPWVLADARALKTVLTNLLRNAMAHAPQGGEIKVRAIRTATEVLIEVEDNGPGVDAAEAERLMRPFEQGDQSLARTTDGAGLGLPIAQLLSRAMGGDLDIRTDRGKGFTAVVRLPAT